MTPTSFLPRVRGRMKEEELRALRDLRGEECPSPLVATQPRWVLGCLCRGAGARASLLSRCPGFPRLAPTFLRVHGPINYSVLQGLFAESEHLFPAVHRLFLAVRGAVVIEKAVAGAVIAVKLVVLAVLLQFGFV
jgi:hypothetical protein